MTRAVLLMVAGAFLLCSSAGWTREPNQGYYQGLSIFYPYKPVYCDAADGPSACYRSPGELVTLPKSAPLPAGHRWCEWADSDDPSSYVPIGNGMVSLTGLGWYQWEARDVPLEKQKYIGSAKVCYLEDRGPSKNINDFKREIKP
jgi:hypothetical protein